MLTMTENEKFYYVVYGIVGESIGVQKTCILNQHPIDFVIEKENEIIILYSIEITKEQGKKYLDMIKDTW